MKLLTNNIISYIFIMFIGISGLAKNAPPAPTQQNSVSAQSQACPTCPPDVPINKNLTILAFTGTLFGLHIIYKHKTNKKRPI